MRTDQLAVAVTALMSVEDKEKLAAGDTDTLAKALQLADTIKAEYAEKTRDPVLEKDKAGGKRKTMLKAIPDLRGSDQPEHEVYLANGGDPYETMRCPDWLYDLVLVAKLHEEIEEVREAMNDPNEYADVLIVLFSLADRHGLTRETVQAAVNRRLDMKGAFTVGKVMRRQA